jgi:hypothetical protein
VLAGITPIVNRASKEIRRVALSYEIFSIRPTGVSPISPLEEKKKPNKQSLARQSIDDVSIRMFFGIAHIAERADGCDR